MTRGKLIRYFVIPLAAVLTFWWGGYFFFKGSSDWREIQALLAADQAIRAQVGDVRSISVAPLPFMYRFSGDNARATLRITVVGAKGEYSATVDAIRRGGVWALQPT